MRTLRSGYLAVTLQRFSELPTPVLLKVHLEMQQAMRRGLTWMTQPWVYSWPSTKRES